MGRANDAPIDHALGRYGIHSIRGPLIVGGVDFLTPQTALFDDVALRRVLSTKERFEEYLQFCERAFEIAATELVSAANSPIDLFLFTMEDAKIFQGYYLFQTIMFREHKKMLLQILHDAQRYSAFRKGLAMIDICQLKNDPEEVLKWLKSSTGWSVLHNSELRIGLKRHMDLLKKHEGNKMNPLSVPEDENVVLDKINAELCSELEKNIGTFDWALMSQYYYKARLSNFARQCAIQARASGVILVKQALPIRETWKEQKQSTSPKVSKLSLEDCLGSLRRPLRRINEQFGRGAARGKPWLLAAFASIATAATVGMSSTR
ncbi:uncharacterized protein LOC127771109 isoform X3 [Oryza glaberrima]|uniref:uncharacterized protein LOC127771109 isoform X3 n=1 Tax=Oryza glaberrima TaxID=4538 RepID=UPI00224C2F22|nr:uncharacterized protein LOC127771109 isoform X3 [Oryza glaberrima]